MSDTEEFNLYLANLEEFVFDENKIVSIGWLSRTLDIGVDLAKKLLSTFTNDETFKSKLSTCWFLYGSSKSDPSSRKILIVPDTKLKGAKNKFEKITSQHVYSIQKSGNSDTDMNSVYLADQSAEKTIAQCSSLSNIKCDHVKVVPNRRNLAAPVTASSTSATSSKPAVNNNAKSSESAKKSPVKSTIGNMFNKKKEEIEKKKETEKSNEGKEKKKEEAEKPNKEVEKDQKVSVSPAKKSSTGAGKKKGPEKGAGSANITSFFSKGASSLPPLKKPESEHKEDVKASTKASKQTNGNSDAYKSSKETNKESDTEAMDVEETDENVEPVKTVDIVEKEKEKDVKKRPNNKESKSNKSNNKKSSANKKASEGKKKAEKKEKETQRKRIRVFSDSSESEQEEEPERERSVSPPPPSPLRAKPAISDDDDDDVIPPTPEATVSNGGGGSRKRKRKLVTKTMTDASGFLRTVKEFETVSCSDSDGESTNQLVLLTFHNLFYSHFTPN
uniref:DNA polymerase delta subunit 3 n=1 Tax=Cacopsylla melanoneura TaxID=428564 RepID=A0A8D8UFE7_9HEMI